MELLFIIGFVFLAFGLPRMLRHSRRKYYYDLTELKKGDLIAMEYGTDVHTGKVIANNPSNRRIIVKVYYIGWFGGTEAFTYDDYGFRPFKKSTYRN